MTECNCNRLVRWASDGQSMAGFVEIADSPRVKEHSFDYLGGMLVFELMLMFANVFVKSQWWFMVEWY